jgi:hypothetical protein
VLSASADTWLTLSLPQSVEGSWDHFCTGSHRRLMSGVTVAAPYPQF